MSLYYMPLYIGDYLRDTRHLTTEQHGAYFQLIMEYWLKGRLPDDDAMLARIVGLSLGKWRTMRPVIQAFFHAGWQHARIDHEREKAAGRSEKARKAANGRHHGKDARSMPGASPEHDTSTAQAMHGACHSGSKSESEPEVESGTQEDEKTLSSTLKSSSRTTSGRSGAGAPRLVDEQFERFKQAYPKRKGPQPWKPAERKFKNLCRDGIDPEAIIAGVQRYAAERRQAGKIGTEFVAQAKTWLNEERWKDDQPAVGAKPATIRTVEFGTADWDRLRARMVDTNDTRRLRDMNDFAEKRAPYPVPAEYLPTIH